ncbi:uncharacterized protein YuzE [Methanococcus maripaludis]|uniref:Uncharacterized protein YuzE n=1 Tax=Methanococcus maripaludis TaxID=39152 RepID=A0A7J9P7B3_METMI|nr:DUF2283 domain-containing protein [Methanococcus maripaludis]MBA2858638.1 uncharacterized protein YuzE [Methanococcus maripaludis]
MSKNECVGTFDYDGLLDVLYHRANPDLDYDKTLDFGNVLIDLSKDQNIKRIEIIDASKLLGSSKFELKHVASIHIKLEISKDKIELYLEVGILKRHKDTPVSFKSKILNDYGLSENTINISTGPALA